MAQYEDKSAKLYDRFLDGDMRALEQLVIEYGDSLTRFAYCIVKDDAAAEDVTADTFATLVIKRKKFRGDAKFRTWLYAVARNAAIDYLRKNGKNSPFTGIENVLYSSCEDDVMNSQRNQVLYAGMQKLPESYRQVLCLSYFDGFSVKEMCHILKKSAKQVYNLLSRARSALKDILVEEGYSYENF